MAWVMPPASLRDHVRVAQRVQQLRLAVVDVTHDGDDRRTGREVVLVAGVLTELQVEGLQQLAVLVLGADHLDLVVQLGAEHLQRVVGHRLGGVTISPRWNSTCTSDAGSTLIFSARSVSDAPRRRRTFCPSPERIRTPPIVGASIWSNSARRALRLLRPRRAWPPRPKAPWVPPRPPGPRVVARTRRATLPHSLTGGEGVVARARGTGARCTGDTAATGATRTGAGSRTTTLTGRRSGGSR
jgi:hypothetical protein